MPSLTSELIISLIDRVSGPAKGAASALQNVAKAEKALQGGGAKGVDNLATGLERVAKSAKGLKADWSKGFSDEIAKLALKSRDLDKLKRSWDDLLKSIGSGGSKNILSAMPKLDAWEKTTLASLRKVESEAKRIGRASGGSAGYGAGGRFAAGALGFGSGAYVANRAVRAGVTATAGNEREGARDYSAGFSVADTARLKAQSLALSKRFPSVDMQTMHQSLRETATSMRSMDKAFEISETLARGLVVLQSLKGKDEALRESAKFFSALDTLGKNLDPAEVKQLYDGYLKALGVEGVDLNLADLKKIAQRSKSAGPGLSNRFLVSTAPGLQGDMGADRLGTALGSEVAQIIGDRATKKAKEAQSGFGLRDGGGWKDKTKIMTDPDLFAWENLIPALKSKGIDPENTPAVTEAMNKIFSNQVVSDLFTKLITQREQYQAKSGQYGRAPGLAGADELKNKDPYVSLGGSVAQLSNIFSLLAEGPLQQAMQRLNAFNDVIGRISEKFGNNPDLAKTTGDAAVKAAAPASAMISGWLTDKGLGWLKPGAGAAGIGGLLGMSVGAGLASALNPNRVMDDKRMMDGLTQWRQNNPQTPGIKTRAGDTRRLDRSPASIWESGTAPIDHLDMSGQAAAAGQKTGEAYKSAVSSALAAVDPIIQAAVQRWAGMLSFSATPTITPKINNPAGGQKSSGLDGVKAKQSAFADIGFNTV